jgi:hypothetical protein
MGDYNSNHVALMEIFGRNSRRLQLGGLARTFFRAISSSKWTNKGLICSVGIVLLDSRLTIIAQTLTTSSRESIREQ